MRNNRKPHVPDADITKALYNAGGNKTVAAQLIGIDRRTLQRRLSKNPALEPTTYSHMPVGFEAHGLSTLMEVVDPETGEARLQWVKSSKSKQLEQAEREEAIEAFKDALPRRAAVKPRKVKRDENLLNLHILTDFHLAMLAWGEETGGGNWDLKIAEDTLYAMFEYAIKSAPKARVGVLGQLGDFTHYDTETLTPTSGHLLDSDTRPQKMVRVAIRALRRVIDLMLKEYEEVHVLMAEGNHDITTSAWLREAFSVFYEGEPRVTVDTSPSPYYVYEWGKTLLLFHHGHLRKVRNIDHVLAAKFREQFGRTKFAYAHMGHLHHKHEVESSLMDIIQHPTMAKQDAYAARNGFLSRRRAPVITYHREYGDVGSITITPEMLGLTEEDD